MGAPIELVFLTEKPSVAKELASHLGIVRRGEGFFEVKGGGVVTWQIGHLLEQAEPEAYVPGAGVGAKIAWDVFPLPVIPPRNGWIKHPKPERDRRTGKPLLGRDGKPRPMEQYGIVLDLLRRAKTVINAGDIDREGQLVADEILEVAGVPADGSVKPVRRLMVTALNAASLDKALKNMKENGADEFVRRRMAATARSQADWLVGMNGTIRATVCAGNNGVLSIGRVQTPTLALVVMRDLSILAFKPVQYFVPYVMLEGGVKLDWHARAEGADMAGISPDGKIVDRRLADGIVARIKAGLTGRVTKADAKVERKGPPRPFNLSGVQVAMSKRRGLSVAETTAACQKLYEGKAITYLGTDCEYLPKSMHAEAPTVLSGLAGRFPQIADGANTAITSKCFDDSKVSAHHAIIPTGVVPAGLNATESKVYEAISRRYMAQFYPDHEFRVTSLESEFGEDLFSARAVQTLREGWRVAEGIAGQPEDDPGEGDKLKDGDQDRAGQKVAR